MSADGEAGRRTAGAGDSEYTFFCLVDGPAYLPKAITALRSFQRFHPAAGFEVVGRFGDDAGAMGLLDRHGIGFRQLDLTHVFTDTIRTPDHPSVTWPSECFWWTAVPDLHLADGCRYGVAIDGDVLCVARLGLTDLFDERAAVAAVAKRNGRINSGVLFFDNARLPTLYDDAVHHYRTAKSCHHDACTGFCRARSDQGLLRVLQERAGLTVRHLDNAYNHMLTWDAAAYLEHNPQAPFDVEGSMVLHLLSKPWRRPPRLRRLNPATCDGYRAWWGFAADIWPDAEERRAHFGEEHVVDPRPSVPRLLGRRARR